MASAFTPGPAARKRQRRFRRGLRWSTGRAVRRRIQRASASSSLGTRFAGDTACGKGEHDEVPLDTPGVVADDDFAQAGQRDRLDVERVSSRTSRITASVRLSPVSTAPPGSVNSPCIGGRARRTIKNSPSRTIAALTARKDFRIRRGSLTGAKTYQRWMLSAAAKQRTGCD